MAHAGPRSRAAVALFSAILLAVLLAAPTIAGTSGRTLDAAPDDAWSHVLFGGLDAVARDSGRRPPVLAGIVKRSTTAGRELAVTVEVSDSAAATAVAAAGLRVANQAGLTVEGYVPESLLGAVALTPGVHSVSPILSRTFDAFTGAEVALHGANAWQAAGFSGQGVKIGIIDGGFEGISALLGTELPAKVQARCFSAVGKFTTNLADCQNGEDHGTGVAEAAVDMAPGVTLFVADPISVLDDQSVITWMTSQGVRIINASFTSGYLFEGPGDGTTPLKNTSYADVNLATSKGALWVNSAGNHGDGGWSGPWVDADQNGFLDFAPGDENETFHLHSGQDIRVAIRWAEPWGSATANYNMGIYHHGDGNALAAGAPIASGMPARIFDFTAPSTGDYDISIKRLSGAATSRMQLLVATEYELSMSHPVPADTLPSPADSANPLMLTVAAADATTPTVVEGYSSRGPTVDNRIKPDITGADCVDTVAIPEFCGTSEASPFVAGGAATVLGANPTFTTKQLVAYLTSHATPMGIQPNSDAGWGLLNLGPVPPPPAGAPTALLFSTQPVGSAATLPLTVQPVLRVVDAAGATVTSGSGSDTAVTLALGSNPGGGVLTCPGGLTAPAVAGVVTFGGCTISTAGSGYTLTAAATGLTPATSAPFETSAPPPPIPLVFTATPATGAANTPLTPAPVVTVEDPQGNPVTAGPAAAAPVTLSLGTNPSAATLVCSGGLTVAAVAGVATFPGCRISGAGDGYTLVATSPGLVQGTSAALSMAAVVAGPDLTIAPSTAAITWGTAVSLAIHATTPAGSTVALSGRTVHVQASPDAATWQPVGDVVLDTTGAASLAYRPVTNLWYRAIFDGGADIGGAATTTARVTVRQLIALRPDNHGIVKTVTKGASLAITVTVRPARPDVPPGKVTVELYAKSGGSWKRISARTAQPSAVGQVQLTISFGSVARQLYVRAMAAPTAVNANSVWTAPQFYLVK